MTNLNAVAGGAGGTGLLNPVPVRAAASGGSTSGTTAAGSSGSTITSSDFLTLLVTELKNQDPTQPSDPTQYVQQLVGVNSLEQLIGINQQIGSIAATKTQAG